MPPKIGSQRVRRETGRSRHHAIVFSITAPYCSSFSSPLVSVRCGANPLHVVSWHCLAIASPVYSLLVISVSSRVEAPLYESYPSRLNALLHSAFPSRSLAGLTRGAVSAYVGHAASLGRPPPTRSGPCRCCAIGTGRAGDRSPATRARSPRPWGSSRGC